MYVNLVRRIPLATTFLIAINIMILGLGLGSGTQLKVIRDYGFVPDSLFHVNDNIPNIIARLFSSIFIHSGIAHLAFNILALAYIGPYSERSVGITRYVLIYILSGVTGVLFHSVIALYTGNRTCSTYRSIRCKFRSIRNSCCHWKY